MNSASVQSSFRLPSPLFPVKSLPSRRLPSRNSNLGPTLPPAHALTTYLRPNHSTLRVDDVVDMVGYIARFLSAWVMKKYRFWPVGWIGSPHPLHRRRLCPLQDPSGGRHTRLWEGGGGVQFRRWDRHYGTLYTNLFSLGSLGSATPRGSPKCVVQ